MLLCKHIHSYIQSHIQTSHTHTFIHEHVYVFTAQRHTETQAHTHHCRGYGRSEGTPSEDGIKMDADAVMRHLARRTDIDNRKIIVLGRSLGGAVGVYVAEK
jgi:dienelactone hydrolase